MYYRIGYLVKHIITNIQKSVKHKNRPSVTSTRAVENYFIIHGYVSSDRTDYNTLIPVLEKHKEAFGDICDWAEHK